MDELECKSTQIRSPARPSSSSSTHQPPNISHCFKLKKPVAILDTFSDVPDDHDDDDDDDDDLEMIPCQQRQSKKERKVCCFCHLRVFHFVCVTYTDSHPMSGFGTAISRI